MSFITDVMFKLTGSPESSSKELKSGDYVLASNKRNYIYFKHDCIYRVIEINGELGVMSETDAFYPFNEQLKMANQNFWSVDYTYSEDHDIMTDTVYFSKKFG